MKNIYEIIDFIKGQTCSLQELEKSIKEMNENAEIEIVKTALGELTYLKLDTSKAIIHFNKFTKEWFVL